MSLWCAACIGQLAHTLRLGIVGIHVQRQQTLPAAAFLACLAAMLTGDLVVQAAWQEGAELAAFRIGFAESLLLQHCLEEALHQILCHVRIVALAAQVATERQSVSAAEFG
ncbi:MAG: hypothetical protein ACOYMN_18760 [Roseimicrobium sp.]